MSDPITLSRTERLMLANQHRILAKLEPDEGDFHEQMVDVFENGYTVEYHKVFERVDEELDEAACKEVNDTLEMYRCLARAVEGFSKEEHTGIDVGEVSVFPGWDGNDRDGGHRMAYARHMQKDHRWEMIKTRDKFNSHMPDFGQYGRMVRAWKESRDVVTLTPADVKRILRERSHPDSPAGRRIAEEKKAGA